MKFFRLSGGMSLVLILTACGGGGGGTPPPQLPSINASVQVSWAPNREVAVNRSGGGYRVYYSRTSGFSVSGATFVDVPFIAPPTAPTNTNLTLASGSNFIKVVAYSALNPGGSEPSAEITVSVPFGAAP